MIRFCLIAIIGFGSGFVIAGAVFAFIAVIGIVPRLAQKSRTTDKIKLYEESIIFGGIFGTLTLLFSPKIYLGAPVTAFLALCLGIFYGCLAVSLAEVLDVIPIMGRRANVQTGIGLFIVFLAFGKLAGSLLYYLIPGFYQDM